MDDVKSVIKNLPKEKDKKIYKTFKEYCQNDSAISAGKFLYLNRNSFFGLGGWMNADRYARESVIKRLKYFSPLMRNTTINNDCFDINPTGKSFIFCDPPYPESNNKSCYNISDDVLTLNLNYLEFLKESGSKFLFITKNIPIIQEKSDALNFKSDLKKWTYRKPGQGVQVSEEIYIYKK